MENLAELHVFELRLCVTLFSGFVFRLDTVETCCPGWRSALLRARSNVEETLQHFQVSHWFKGNQKALTEHESGDNRQKKFKNLRGKTLSYSWYPFQPHVISIYLPQVWQSLWQMPRQTAPRKHLKVSRRGK